MDLWILKLYAIASFYHRETVCESVCVGISCLYKYFPGLACNIHTLLEYIYARKELQSIGFHPTNE